MTELLLDTNAVIALLNNKPACVREKYKGAVRKKLSVEASSIVIYELAYGAFRSQRIQENSERLRVFLSGAVGIVQFDEEDAFTAGELRASLEAAGTPIGPYDTLIAAQALRRGYTLITANTAEFSRVKGLKFQDWS